MLQTKLQKLIKMLNLFDFIYIHDLNNVRIMPLSSEISYRNDTDKYDLPFTDTEKE